VKFNANFDSKALTKFPSISDKLLCLTKARNVSGVTAELIGQVDNMPDDESQKRKLLLSAMHFIILS